MIPQINITAGDDWQSQLRNVITSGEELLELLHLTRDQVGYSELAGNDFPLKVPRAFVARMRVGDPRDPLLRQVLGTGQELLAEPGYNEDPVGETADAISRPGIIQKYRGRLLLILSSGCAVNCRYCFRRHFPYSENQNSRKEWLQAIDHIAQDTTISEVILSGGDPLLVADDHLQELVAKIAAVKHVKRLRVHTRLPVVIPQRVAPGLLDAITHPSLQTVLVIHANHANELDYAVGEAMLSARASGITLLNQAVLLAGVNDNTEALTGLSKRLFELGVLPYYLHLLDKVRGAAHFDVEETRARALIEEISGQLPGYLVPKLVREEAGALAKTPVV